MEQQKIMFADNDYNDLDEYLKESRAGIILLVCGRSMNLLKIGEYFNTAEDRLGLRIIRFEDFQPNPSYESIVKGIKAFCENKCELIIAVGGGSAMDVAKCIKLYSNMDCKTNYLNQKIEPNDISLLAVPTTAGSGSEATQFAVIYYNGKKYSVSHKSCLPSAVLIDSSALKTLPEYQKKSCMMDALCHAIESCWSIKSTETSQAYSREAIEIILKNKDLYLSNDDTGNANMLRAANIAGKAINITQTTAGHAMCYKLTSLYGIAHGHAAALCVSKLWLYMLENRNKCIDSRGIDYLDKAFKQIAAAMGCADSQDAANLFNLMVADLNLGVPAVKSADYEILKLSVNQERLKNNPVFLDADRLNLLYHQILDVE